MTILEEIIAHKREEVSERKALFPTRLLEKSVYYESKPVSLRKYVTRPDKIGLIAEFKRRSPSKGDINQHASIERTSIGYMQAGASGLSVLTDSRYFGGSNEDLSTARKFNFCPVLRKDFVMDEYQIIEAKSIGADAILLIAAALDTKDINALSRFAHTLDLEVLLEVHNKEEMDRSVTDSIDLLGVNNRNLGTFETSVDVSRSLVGDMPKGMVKISESGISDPAVVAELTDLGFDGFLIGEHFMQYGRPEKACQEFVEKVRNLKNHQ